MPVSKSKSASNFTVDITSIVFEPQRMLPDLASLLSKCASSSCKTVMKSWCHTQMQLSVALYTIYLYTYVPAKTTITCAIMSHNFFCNGNGCMATDGVQLSDTEKWLNLRRETGSTSLCEISGTTSTCMQTLQM